MGKISLLGKEKLYQWELNRKILIPDDIEADEVHFAHENDKEALVVKTQNDEEKKCVADIPNILLQSDKKIKMWIVKNNQTVCFKFLIVIERAKPADYVYEETEILRYENLEKRIAALEEKFKNQSGGLGGDGFSPEAMVQQTENGVIITITDKNGTTKAIVENGKDGEDGSDGQTPYIDENGYIVYGANKPKSIWNNRNLVAFGTSITRECDKYAGGYLEVVKKRLGFRMYTNKGVSGASMISNGTTKGDNILNCIKNTDLSNHDLIMFECSTNDFKLNVPLGTVGNMGDSNFDTTTFCGAVRSAIEYILTNYPMKHILLIASFQRYDGDYNVNKLNGDSRRQIDYVDALVSIGELYGIPVVDLYRKSPFNALTISQYTYDNLHPNAMGYMMLGNLIASEIGNMACVFSGSNAVWTDTTLTLNGQVYDISVSAGYTYKMVMNLNGTLYLYYDNEPLKVYKGSNRECFYSDCYRTKNNNGVFGEIENIIGGVNQTQLSDGYKIMNKDRTLDQYVISNHDLLYWGSDEIAVYGSGVK